jgi:hypothetical protein
MAAIRRRFPSLRRTAPTAIARSGSEMTVFACLCGATHSVPTGTRAKAKHAQAFVAAHLGCAAELARRIETLTLIHRNARHGNVVGVNTVLSAVA